MKKQKIFALAAITLMLFAGSANAETILLASDDFVGISFWLLSMACLASTVFFFLERGSVPVGWRVSITIAGLITGIAFIHYMYMRQIWVIGEMSTLYRYIDWFITVPLIMLQFYFVLSAVRKVPIRIFWKLLIGSIIMVCGGYLGEAGYIINAMTGFIIYMVGWIYILYEVFSGDAGVIVAKSGNKPLVTAFGGMRMIITIGWAVYPLGYIFGYLTGGIDANSINVIYNVADFINKIAFGLIIWAAAMQQSVRTR